MVSRKYVGDYEIDEQYNPRTKRMKEVPVYVGPWFVFVHKDEIRRIKRLYLLLSLACGLCVCGLLLINARCSHIWYSMVPIVFSMIPLVYLAAADLRLITAGERMTREHRDKVEERFANVSLALLLLMGLALIGHGVYSVRWGDTPLDLLFYLLEAGAAAAAGMMYFRRELIAAEEAEEE